MVRLLIVVLVLGAGVVFWYVTQAADEGPAASADSGVLSQVQVVKPVEAQGGERELITPASAPSSVPPLGAQDVESDMRAAGSLSTSVLVETPGADAPSMTQDEFDTKLFEAMQAQYEAGAFQVTGQLQKGDAFRVPDEDATPFVSYRFEPNGSVVRIELEEWQFPELFAAHAALQADE